ncbi:hypothetical protein PHYSODRAFT_305534 [Phytophthora sojae]|uniref:Uncharacterized protein n=1 Tax=Phytophthora sojae (strain P6497) TaxID=1094619 RepID=G5A5H4_PHYSP|nr:hypothetical protein PHYSODRAFT_305534 [Phytophthora sojae]EGZ08579.1 hypothetical protein PHYSODRAFT_305534 [Phytophthora sojae]|eukprot:XP_009535212.1 hypothetical protein PHYSODRAFT_305534 [Phytophthora sojae]
MDYDVSSTPSELMEILDALGSSHLHSGTDTEPGSEINSVSADGIRNDAEVGGSATTLSVRHKVPMGRRRRKRICKVGSVPYSTDLQRRRKAEVESLRLEVRELEDKLAQLHLQHVGGATAFTKNKCEPWRQVAELATKKLQYSEHTNRELKESLSSLFGTCSNIRELLTKCEVRKRFC